MKTAARDSIKRQRVEKAAPQAGCHRSQPAPTTASFMGNLSSSAWLWHACTRWLTSKTARQQPAGVQAARRRRRKTPTTGWLTASLAPLFGTCIVIDSHPALVAAGLSGKTPTRELGTSRAASSRLESSAPGPHMDPLTSSWTSDSQPCGLRKAADSATGRAPQSSSPDHTETASERPIDL